SGSGNPNMATIDHVIADSNAKTGLPSDIVAYTASYREIQELGGIGISYRADGSPTPLFSNPATLWDKYFSDAKIPADAKALLVDRVLDDYKSVRNNPRLGSEDRARLDTHIAQLAVTEAKVKRVAAVCEQLRPDISVSDRNLVLTTMNSVIVGLI